MRTKEKEAEYSRRNYLNHRDAKIAGAKKYRSTHKDMRQRKDYTKQFKLDHPDYHRNWNYIHYYGITLDDYNQMFLLQKGKCLICGKHQSETKFTFPVDHDHITGKVRGLVCRGCNVKIGWYESFKDKIDRYLL